MEINSHIFPHLEFLKLSLYFVSGRLTATTTSFSRTLPVSGWRARRMPDYVDQTRSTCSTQPNVRSCRTARANWSFNSTIVLSRSGKELNIGDNIRTSTLRRTRIKDLSSSFDDRWNNCISFSFDAGWKIVLVKFIVDICYTTWDNTWMEWY